MMTTFSSPNEETWSSYWGVLLADQPPSRNSRRNPQTGTRFLFCLQLNCWKMSSSETIAAIAAMVWTQLWLLVLTDVIWVSWPSGRGQILCNYAPPPPTIHPWIPTVGWEGEGKSATPHHPPPPPITIPTHNTAVTKLIYIKLSMYLFFYMEPIPYLMVLRRATSITRGIRRGGPIVMDQNHYVPRHINNSYIYIY